MAAYMVEESVVPNVETAVTITTAISPAISPYSMAVEPLVSRRKFLITGPAAWGSAADRLPAWDIATGPWAGPISAPHDGAAGAFPPSGDRHRAASKGEMRCTYAKQRRTARD